MVYITTAKLKSANILAIAILGSINARQYFRLYGIAATDIWPNGDRFRQVPLYVGCKCVLSI